MKCFNTLTSCNPSWCSDKLDLVGKFCFSFDKLNLVGHFGLVQGWQIGLDWSSLVWTRFDKLGLVGRMGAKGWDGAVGPSILCPKTRWGSSPCHTLLHGIRTLIATRLMIFHIFSAPGLVRELSLFFLWAKTSRSWKSEKDQVVHPQNIPKRTRTKQWQKWGIT